MTCQQPVDHACSKAAAVRIAAHDECGGDDAPEGKIASFPFAVKREPDESVVFSWVLWPSREARDAGWKKVMADARMQSDVTVVSKQKRLEVPVDKRVLRQVYLPDTASCTN